MTGSVSPGAQSAMPTERKWRSSKAQRSVSLRNILFGCNKLSMNAVDNVWLALLEMTDQSVLRHAVLRTLNLNANQPHDNCRMDFFEDQSRAAEDTGKPLPSMT